MMELPSVVVREDGATCIPSSPELLRDLLSEFERELLSSSFPLDDYFNRGLARDEVSQAIEAAGLIPNAEVVEWFVWRDGRRRPKKVRLGPTAAAVMSFNSLQEGIELHQIRRDNVAVLIEQSEDDPELIAHIDFGIGAGFLQITDRDTESWAVESVHDLHGISPRVHRGMTQFHRFPGLWRAESLCTIATWLIEAVRDGAFVDADGRWGIRDEAWPDDMVRLGFR